jgi:hypothetical protein
MTNTKAISGTALALMLAFGCSAANTGDAGTGSGELDPNGPASIEAVSVDSSKSEATEAKPGNPAGSGAGVGRELARLDFENGSVVRFEELADGIVVSELSPAATPSLLGSGRHTTALDAYRRLAPKNAVPAALAEVHRRLHPAALESVEQLGDATEISETPAAEELQYDSDLEHTGQFQQAGGSYSFSQFLIDACNIPVTARNYKHGNATSSHTHTTTNVNTAYFAVAADIGIISSRACSNGACGSPIQVQPGFRNSGFFDAGQQCTGGCAPLDFVCQILGEVRICSPKKVKFEVRNVNISSQIRMHDCAAFTG